MCFCVCCRSWNIGLCQSDPSAAYVCTRQSLTRMQAHSRPTLKCIPPSRLIAHHCRSSTQSNCLSLAHIRSRSHLTCARVHLRNRKDLKELGTTFLFYFILFLLIYFFVIFIYLFFVPIFLSYFVYVFLYFLWILYFCSVSLFCLFFLK